MADITPEFAKDRLALYLEAEAKVLSGQSYTVGGRSLTRAQLSEIRDGISYWRGQVSRLDATGQTGPTVRRIIPIG